MFRVMADRLPGPRPIALGEIARQGVPIFCWCNRCGHNAELDAHELARLLGPAIPVPAIAGRLRCRGCGARDVAARPAWPSLGQVARHGVAKRSRSGD